MMRVEAEEAVIVKEAEERDGGEIEHLVRRGGPDGGTHGDQE
jgi:hypothetical protein